METEFKHNPTDNDYADLRSFYLSLAHVTIEQYPQWSAQVNKDKHYCYFFGKEEGKIVASAVIEESKKMQIRWAAVHFGPLFSDPDNAVTAIAKLAEYYRNLGYSYLSIQLGFPSGPIADYIEYKVSSTAKFKNFFDRDNWSSRVIHLAANEEDLRRDLSKGHKSDTKKAQKAGLSVIDHFSEEQFEAFAGIYSKMHRERGLQENSQGSAAFLRLLKETFHNDKLGKFVLVKNGEEQVLGGIALVFQGKTVRYFKGAADPSVRNLPVLHLAIWESILWSKQKGFELFDLWGYNHFVDESDQVYHINRFKKGFGGSFSFYPKKMYFFFKPLQYRLLKFSQKIYRKIK